jgi:hypothetical protein
MYEAMRQRRAASVQPKTANAPVAAKKQKGLGSI